MLPIHTKFEYVTSGDTLSTIYTTLSQGDKSFQIIHSDSDPNHVKYIETVESVIKAGLTLSFSNWGRTGGMTWLDGMTGCVEDCQSPTMYVSNITVFTGPDAEYSNTGAFAFEMDPKDFL